MTPPRDDTSPARLRTIHDRPAQRRLENDGLRGLSLTQISLVIIAIGSIILLGMYFIDRAYGVA